MRTRDLIEGDRIVPTSVLAEDTTQSFLAIMHEQHLWLEVALDIRDILNKILNQPPLSVTVTESPEEIIERWKDRQ